MRWGVSAGLLFAALILGYVWRMLVRQFREGRILTCQYHGLERKRHPVRFWTEIILQLVLIVPFTVAWWLTLLTLLALGILSTSRERNCQGRSLLIKQY